ncbi:uncharacterized protein LOC113798500 [Dermatophagoides pteronyssinus]|uniref:uncharacterized protein LOC113798500 n=1 Tax=Dermatophagoides pteronyssinus TaxID=6956 RepID=UPI003F664211
MFCVYVFFVIEFKTNENVVQSFRAWFIVLIDMFLGIFVAGMIALQISLLTISVATTASLHHCCDFNDLSKKFRLLSQQLCLKQNYSNKNSLQLRSIYFEHIRLSGYIIRGDREKWSRASFQFIMIGIPFNVCFVCFLLFGHPGPIEQILYLFFTVMHLLITIFPSASRAHVHKWIIQIRSYIPKTISYIRNIRLKLQYDDFYNRLMYGKPCCFTFGFMGAVTYSTLVQVTIAYMTLFTMVASFYMKNFIR